MGSAAQWAMGSTDLRSQGLRRRVHIGASGCPRAGVGRHRRRTETPRVLGDVGGLTCRPECRIGHALGLRSGSHHDGVE
jgi:hypothetical protein